MRELKELAKEGQAIELIHPGRELLPEEERFYTSVVDHKNGVTLSTFADLQQEKIPHATDRSAAVRVGISSSPAPDGRQLGFGTHHYDELAVRLARVLMNGGCQVQYGGWIKDDDPFSQVLLDAAINATREEAEDGSDEETTPLLESVQAWPHHKSFTAAAEADLHGICSIYRVDPPDGPGDDGKRERDALTRMRAAVHSSQSKLAIPTVDLRIALGGKMRGYAGAMPGVAEEVYYALESDVPLLILGGFGGVAGHIADWVLGDSALPRPLSKLSTPLLKFKHTITMLRRGTRTFVGLDYAQLSAVMTTQSVSAVVRTLAAVVADLRSERAFHYS
ncbi:MAG: hypothetical protein AAGA68_22505 [Pseudomonadota bacterium]